MKSSPQPSKSRIVQNYLIFALAIILIIFPFFILKSISSTVLFLFLILISVGSSFFFWVSFVPFFPESISGVISTIQTLILSIFRSTKSIYHIQAGKFDKDYFVIQNKPKLGALLIDGNSVVIVINNGGKKRVCPPGYQFINTGEQVLHTFDIGFHHFYWGPLETENPFNNHISDLYLNQIHLRALRVAQTKCQTKDEISVVPSFSIFYDFSSLAGKKQLDEMTLNISNHFFANNIYGELQIEINKLIGERVTKIWKVLLRKTNAKQILSPTDQNSSLMNIHLLSLNTTINTKIAGDTSDSHMLKEFNKLGNINPLEQWGALNIRVFLNNLWIQQEVP